MRDCNFIVLVAVASMALIAQLASAGDRVTSFDSDWRFNLGEATGADKPAFADANWRKLDLPHDWMIEGPPGKDPSTMDGPFDRMSPGGTGAGALNGGVGWYRKSFHMADGDKGKHIAIQFDGIYMNSDVWINGQHLGTHLYGYTSFEYDLTPYLKFGTDTNIMAVRANVVQPCSRFYSGAGIYRHTWLTITAPLHVAHWGSYVTTAIEGDHAVVTVRTTIANDGQQSASFSLDSDLLDPAGKPVGHTSSQSTELQPGKTQDITQTVTVPAPQLWSIETPVAISRGIQPENHGRDCRSLRNTVWNPHHPVHHRSWLSAQWQARSNTGRLRSSRFRLPWRGDQLPRAATAAGNP